jgi:uncharacterized protein
MYFPVAVIEINSGIPPAVAFAISLFTSMGGVSGAFLLLPFQISILGFNSPAVSATNHLFNIVAIPGGVWRYSREGRMVWPLTWIIIIGTLPGVRHFGRSDDPPRPHPPDSKKEREHATSPRGRPGRDPR